MMASKIRDIVHELKTAKDFTEMSRLRLSAFDTGKCVGEYHPTLIRAEEALQLAINQIIDELKKEEAT